MRFAVDFSAEMNLFLAAPFCLLAAGSLFVGGANIFHARKPPLALPKALRAALLTVIPLGFLASSLGCTGLSLKGCSSFCTFIKLLWIPLVCVVCAFHFFAERGWLLTAITAMAFVPLVPHCVCYNAGNGWWIDFLGASPVCYVWGFVVSLISISALRTGARPWLSLAVSSTIIAGATTFFVSHHYFHFPW